MKKFIINLLFWLSIVYGCATFISLTLVSCEKEPETVTFATVKTIHPLEGRYKGTITLRCDSLSYNKTYSNDVRISSFSLEELCIKNNLCVGIAYPSVSNQYNLGQMQWIDINDCGQLVSFNFYGSGHTVGDSLIENGHFIIYIGNHKFSGKWKSRAVKVSN